MNYTISYSLDYSALRWKVPVNPICKLFWEDTYVLLPVSNKKTTLLSFSTTNCKLFGRSFGFMAVTCFLIYGKHSANWHKFHRNFFIRDNLWQTLHRNFFIFDNLWQLLHRNFFICDNLLQLLHNNFFICGNL